jgi:hypothetical protein
LQRKESFCVRPVLEFHDVSTLRSHEFATAKNYEASIPNLANRTEAIIFVVTAHRATPRSSRNNRDADQLQKGDQRRTEECIAGLFPQCLESHPRFQCELRF